MVWGGGGLGSGEVWGGRGLGRERFGRCVIWGGLSKCGVVVLALTLASYKNLVLSNLPEYRTTAGGLPDFKCKHP